MIQSKLLLNKRREQMDNQELIRSLQQLGNIFITQAHIGQYHMQEINLMYACCAFKQEVESGTSKALAPILCKNANSSFQKEVV